MGKTVRFNPEIKGKKKGLVRHPRRNRAEKGEVRPKAVPPSDYDDLQFAAYDENWHSRHPETEAYDPDLKRNKSKWRSESKRVRREAESKWQEFDEDELDYLGGYD